ncbi:MAG: family efflux transporter [Aeromicrobium sp.]|nr:family efflux transporter [Aeromicrobium sp.]
MRLRSDLDRQIVRVTVPTFFALVSEPLMLLADTAIVGHLGTPELAGLAAAAIVLGTAVGLCVFLAYGSTALVARHHGAGDEGAALGFAISSLWLAAGLGVGLGAVIAATSGALASALSSSEQVADLARQYLLVSALSLPAMLLVLAATGSLRGALDLRTPLWATVTANVLNVVLSSWFVYGLDAGVRGAAAGTVVAQWFAASWLVAVVVRRARQARASTAPRPIEILAAGLAGLPLLVRTLTLRAALVLATLVAARLGDVPLAAHQVVGVIVTFLAYGLDAIAIAGQTLTGRALGAGDAAGTRAMTRRMVQWGAASGVLAAVALAASAPWLPRAFTSDTAVQDALVPALLVVAAIQPASAVVFVLDGVLIGAGDAPYLARSGLLVLLAYAPLALAVGWTDAGFTWLWVAYGGFIAARLMTLWHRQRGDSWMVLGSRSTQ